MILEGKFRWVSGSSRRELGWKLDSLLLKLLIWVLSVPIVFALLQAFIQLQGYLAQSLFGLLRSCIDYQIRLIWIVYLLILIPSLIILKILLSNLLLDSFFSQQWFLGIVTNYSDRSMIILIKLIRGKRLPGRGRQLSLCFLFPQRFIWRLLFYFCMNPAIDVADFLVDGNMITRRRVLDGLIVSKYTNILILSSRVLILNNLLIVDLNIVSLSILSQ